MDLIGDIGATNSRLALLDDRGEVVKSESFVNEGFASIDGLLKVFLEHRRATDKPRRAALAIAAPVLGDEVSMLNLDWRFSQIELKRMLDVSRLIVVNDFAAIAWSLPVLSVREYRQIGTGTAITGSTMAAIGPGSGLGVGGIVPATEGWAALSGEGGHVTLAPNNERESAVIEEMRKEYGHCSAERLLSGPGLVRLYRTLAHIAGRDSEELAPTDVTALARQQEPLARETCAMFFEMLGSVAGDLALTLGARGGVFIAGGIVPRLHDALSKSKFRERFVAKGRYRDYLEAIPTFLITDPVPAFFGLRTLLGFR